MDAAPRNKVDLDVSFPDGWSVENDGEKLSRSLLVHPGTDVNDDNSGRRYLGIGAQVDSPTKVLTILQVNELTDYLREQIQSSGIVIHRVIEPPPEKEVVPTEPA